MAIKFTNRATSLLAGSITADDTAIALASGTGARFPSLSGSEWFPIAAVAADGGYEIMRATARAGDVVTVQRGQEGTEARVFDAGALIDLRLTAGALAAIITDMLTNTSDVSGETLADALNALNAGKVDTADIDLQAKWSCGDVKLTFKSAADAGWVMLNDGTIGDASSGASARANADTQALCTLLFDNFDDATVPLLSSTGTPTTRAAQANAANAFAAHCRFSVPKALGCAIGIAGAGSGLTARSLGQKVGSETNTIAQANLPNITLNTTIPAGQGAHTHTSQGISSNQNFGDNPAGFMSNGGSHTTSSSTLPEMTGTTPLGGSGTAVNNMQPTSFWNAMVKL